MMLPSRFRHDILEDMPEDETVEMIYKIGKAIHFVFSRKGFTKKALDYFREHGIAYSDDERWLG